MTDEDPSGPVSFEPDADHAVTPTGGGLLIAPRAKERFLPKLRKAQQSHPPRPVDEMVMDYLTLRAVIGLIAFFLVPVVYVGNWLLFTRHVGECFWPNPRLPDSLSGYYYTHMRNLFVGAMCAMGIFLAAYRGFDRWDSRLTNVAGLAAIGIALCPTAPPSYAPNGTNLFFTPANVCGPATPITYQQSTSQTVFGVVHIVSLIVLFVMVILMVLVQFTLTHGVGEARGDPAGGLRAWRKSVAPDGFRAWCKSLFPDGPRNRRKRRRNLIYVLCAVGIALCALLALVSAFSWSVGSSAHLLLFAESFAFAFFGFAWYVKGAASAANHPQLFVWVLSRPVYWWLADDPDDEAAGDSELATAGSV
jgi:hypothetical protein